MDELDIAVKMIIVGEASVGKTVLLKRYVKDEFLADSIPTIGTDLFRHSRKVDGANILLTLWDTAGQERVRSITPTMYKECMGALLVYDTTNSQSFAKLEFWRRELIDNCPKSLMIMLVGNKIDLVDQRQVSTEEGRDFAQRHGLLFMETSAKTNVDNCVPRAFESLIETVARPLIADERAATKNRITEIEGSIVPLKLENEEKGCC